MAFHVMILLHEYLHKIYPQQFQECFLCWMKSIQKITDGEVVAIDGKTLCGSHDKNSHQSAI